MNQLEFKLVERQTFHHLVDKGHIVFNLIPVSFLFSPPFPLSSALYFLPTGLPTWLRLPSNSSVQEIHKGFFRNPIQDEGYTLTRVLLAKSKHPLLCDFIMYGSV